MTKYQKKRRLLNKLNARTRSMANKYGIDRHLIADKAVEGLPGVIVDEEFGTINIVPGFESDELYEALDKAVLTNTQAEVKAMEPYENFIGPLPKGTVNREVKSMYEFEDEIEDVVNEYYELEAAIKESPWLGTKEFKDFESRLSSLGSQWRDEVPYTQLLGLLDDIKKFKGELS